MTETRLDLLDARVMAALRAGTHLRIVTGDYLAFNQVDALRRLGWSQVNVRNETEPSETEPSDTDAPPSGQLRVRVVETALADRTEHPFNLKLMPPLARRPLRGRSAVPSKRVLAHRSGALRAREGDRVCDVRRVAPAWAPLRASAS